MKLIITDIENFDLTVDGPHRVIKPGEGSPKHCIGCGCAYWRKRIRENGGRISDLNNRPE
ncbi:MAG: hypothetical protein II376_04585 [Clostridia bacterium]|nr:hypothetical protein [Clostridia bacterium]